MAYTDDAVLAKLSALNETQESIVTVAQWVMFHRRFADRTGQLWLQKLKDSGSNKRLNLIYLANEVAQQSKARKKDDFLLAFSPVIAEATATAYKGATNEVQQKLKRVVEVWRARNIFEVPIQEAIEARIDQLERTRAAGGKRAGGSIFSSNNSGGIPNELADLVGPQQTITNLVLSTKTSLNSASKDYENLTDPSAVTPTPPVHAARLNGLLKVLANAEGAVVESIKARKVLIDGLERILNTNRLALAAEEAQLSTLANRKLEIDAKKKGVEDGIMRGLGPLNSPGTPAGPSGSPGAVQTPVTPAPEVDRPEVEALTPPPQSPSGFGVSNGHGSTTPTEAPPPVYTQPPPTAGLDLLSSLSTSAAYNNASAFNSSYNRPISSASGGSNKKRKLNMGDDFPDLGGEDAMDALDPDVAEMLRQDSGSPV